MATFHPVVSFDPAIDTLVLMDFTAANTSLTPVILNNTTLFTNYIQQVLQTAGATYGIGGYNEHRTIYSRSEVFNDATEPRRLHLGIDIWGKEGTPVYAPLDGTIHSFAFNDHYGDYGATIILQHTQQDPAFHTLYGHLSLQDLEGLYEGKTVQKGEVLGHFGGPTENGHWPPHLHFQLITNMEGWKGDYPGVCKFSEREKYLDNCPNPDHILQMMRYVSKYLI